MLKPKVTLVYNTCAYVLKFRLRLIDELKRAGYEVFVIAPTDYATSDLVNRGIPHRPIPMTQYGMNPFSEIGSMFALRQILKELRPVASLHYTIKPNTFGSMVAHQLGIPVLNNIAGAGRAFSSGNPIVRKLVIELYRHGLRNSYAVFFQNNDDMAVFHEEGLVNESQCRRIPGSGVDLTRFKAAPLPVGTIRFLFVGRLLKEKGIVEFLQAANSLLANATNAAVLQFDVVGEFEDTRTYISRHELEQLTKHPQISFCGAVPPERVDEMITNATCVVLPSYYGEGVPRVLLEACASGRPIITTDNVGCRDVLQPGINGWLVPVRDVDALVDAMQSCMNAGHDQLTAYGKNARRFVEDHFDEQVVIQAYLDCLASLPAAPH